MILEALPENFFIWLATMLQQSILNQPGALSTTQLLLYITCWTWCQNTPTGRSILLGGACIINPKGMHELRGLQLSCCVALHY